ncbi:MAG: carboxypeptidase regulatory-like domain-containing protein [Myxococcales bacterium]|nr:carboxypeptidase regulatory-like domain-containing protein [Myxococcales bacterium]
MSRRSRLIGALLLGIVGGGLFLSHEWFSDVESHEQEPISDQEDISSQVVHETPELPPTQPESPPPPPVILPKVVSRATSLQDKTLFSGRVINRKTKEGVPGVQLQFAQGASVEMAYTDTNGNFEFTPRESGTYLLASAEADGFSPFAPPWGTSPMRFVAQPGYELKGILVQLSATIDMLVTVQGEDGGPIEQTKLQVINNDGSMMERKTPIHTDHRGTARLAVSEGTLIEAHHPAFNIRRYVVTQSDINRGEVRLQLAALSNSAQPSKSIAGIVVNDSGEPIAGAKIVATPMVIGLPAPRHTPPSWRTVSLADGSFEFSPVPTGAFTLSVTHPDYAPTRYEPAVAGATDLQIKLSIEGGFIYGRVYSAPGKSPVIGFVLMIFESLGKLEERPVYNQSFFGPDGGYRVGPIVPGTYRLRALAHGFAASPSTEVRLTNGNELRVDIELERGGTITGVVLDKEELQPIEGASITLDGLQVGTSLPFPVDANNQTNANGYFELRGVPSGQQSIGVAAKGYHKKAISRLVVTQSGDVVGPLEVFLTPLAEDEEAKVELVGIGAAVGPQGDYVVVGQIIPGGGAAQADLQTGDLITEIDGETVSNIDFGEVVQRIRGPEGSSVRLRVIRGNQQMTINVARSKVRG